MEKLNMQTTNIVDENIKRIGELFPNCLTERLNDEGKPEVAIDFDQLRQELSKDIVEGTEERYQFTWPDKRNAIRLANAPTTDTLRPCREESVDFDNTQNLYIEGDNLQVLKLLRENYLGKVKMIYIDPPYNTGNDFVYNDKFSVSADEWDEMSGELDEGADSVKTFIDTFPAGTLSGAPKVRAMQIITELEPHNRGAYGGCVGSIGFDGSLNQAITIRTFVSRGGELWFQAGGGIVAKSDPERELQEVNNKLGALRKAVELAAKL